MALNVDLEKHKGRPWILHTDESCVIAEGMISEDRRVKVRETH
jgi:hypothetical protein